MFIIVIHSLLYYYSDVLSGRYLHHFLPTRHKMAAECPARNKTEKKESTQCPIGSHVEGSEELDPRNMVLIQLLL